MVRPLAALLAVVLLAAGCGGGTAGDGSRGQVPAAGNEIPPEVPVPPPPEGGVEPAAPAELPAPAPAEPSGEPQEPAAADPTEPAGETASAAPAGGSIEPQEQGTQATPPAPEPSDEAQPAADPTEPAGEPATAADPGGHESDGEDTVEPLAATDPAATAPPAGGPDTPAGESDPAVEPVGAGGALEFADCGRVYLCATLAVPADHDDPGGAPVELAVGMIPAGDPSRRIGYLLVNPGGPGEGMHAFLSARAGLSTGLLDRFDVVGWDPRGVGGSVPSGCWGEARDLHLVDPVPDSSEERAALEAAARALAEACAAELGDLVGRIGTIEVVRDMDAIRRALGAETISYLGFSYGTLLGVHYAGMFGDHLRAAVLDGVIDPSLAGVELLVEQTIGFARTIDDMFAWCRNDPICPVTGDPAEVYDRLLRQVDEDPMRDPTGDVVLDPARAILALVVGAYDSSLWPLVFNGLAAAVDGDGTMLGLVGEAYIGWVDLGALVSINCTDGGAATRAEVDALAEALAAVAGDFGRASVAPTLACLYWPVDVGTLPVGAIAAPDAPPILVVGNRGDNATPYEWAASVARQLQSGVLVSFDGTGHTSYGRSDCVDRVVDDYLIDLVVPPADVDCPAES